MKTPQIMDETEARRTIVVNQRAYEVPADVANKFTEMRSALGNAHMSIAFCRHQISSLAAHAFSADVDKWLLNCDAYTSSKLTLDEIKEALK